MSISDINVWLGMTQNASEHGGLVDHMLGFVHWFMLVLFIGWSTFLAIAFYKFRASKNAKADYHGVRGHATTHIEIGVCIVEAILLLGFAQHRTVQLTMQILQRGCLKRGCME